MAVPVQLDLPRPSANQEALWLQQQQAPDSSAYNIAAAARLVGHLSIDALHAAFQALGDRHDALRCVFPAGPQGPAIALQGPGALNFATIDASGWNDERAHQALLTAAREPFALERQPAFRVRVFRRSAHEAWLLLAVHHLVADAWSLGVLWRELGLLYPAIADGGLARPLPAAPSYLAHLQAHHGRMASADTEIARAYWRSALADPHPQALFHPSPAGSANAVSAPREYRLSFDAQALNAFAAGAGTTPFVTLLAAYRLLLAQQVDARDFVIGAPTHGRRHTAEAGLVGYLTNLLPLRLRLDERQPFRELVRQEARAFQAARTWQALPFALIAREAASDAPLVQATFAFQQPQRGAEPLAAWIAADARATVSLGELAVQPYPLAASALPFPVMLEAVMAAGQLSVCIRTDPSQPAVADADRLADQFQALLAGALAAPDRPLDGQRAGSPARARGAASGSHGQAQAVPCLHALFEAQARRAPMAPAVIAGQAAIGYAELDQRADVLAARLRAGGVGREIRVGLVAPRSIDWVVTQLAVLKAGGAFVPLDAGQPSERLAALLSDAGCQVVFAPAGLDASICPAGMPKIALESPLEPQAPAVERQPGPPVGTQDLAYLIFTSGSSGRPKGVMIEHAAASNTLMAINAGFGVGPGDRLLAVSSPGFDLAIYDVLGTLAAGATLVLPEPERALDPAHWLELIAREQITIWNSAPALATLLLDAAAARGAAELGSLRLMLSSGECMPRDLPARVRRFAPRARLVNLGGATECAIWSVAHVLEDAAPADERIPYGRPLPNQTAYVLDAASRPCPPGVVGELYIGGAGLARGYLDRPDLTAERFGANPLGPGRLYRTGDACSQRPDGTLDWLGRLDDQIKIGGVRIEPAEVEAVLRRHPAVLDVRVVLDDRPAGRPALVAYLVADGPCDGPAIRHWVARQLPRAMVPAALVPLAALPLTANGKLDRQALPAPAMTAPAPPASPREATIAAIWAEVLGPGPDTHASFDELGGDSLSALRIVTRLSAWLGREVSLGEFYAWPSVTAFAAHLEGPASAHEPADGWRLDGQLPAAIRPAGHGCPSSPPRRILLTGASGFFGAFLLAELLGDPAREVVCLVRAPDAMAGQQRIASNLQRYGLWQAGYASRIVAIAGDLALERLGLTADAFAELARSIEAILHAGAAVNLAWPYAALRSANASGTLELLRLACETRAKPFCYVSSLAVLAAEDPDASGYARSKCAGERLVAAAGERGLPVTIVRPGEILGDRRSGRSNPADLVSMAIDASLQLGCLPALGSGLYVAPVDAVAAATVQLALETPSNPRPRHLIHPAPLTSQALASLLAACGHDLSVVPFDHWRGRLLDAPAAPASPLATVQAFFGAIDRLEQLQLPDAPAIAREAAQTIALPGLDAPALGRYLAAAANRPTGRSRVSARKADPRG